MEKSVVFKIIKPSNYLSGTRSLCYKLYLILAPQHGANAEEAIGATSKKDFKSKFDNAYREAREKKYWLKLLRDNIILEEN